MKTIELIGELKILLRQVETYFQEDDVPNAIVDLTNMKNLLNSDYASDAFQPPPNPEDG